MIAIEIFFGDHWMCWFECWSKALQSIFSLGKIASWRVSYILIVHHWQQSRSEHPLSSSTVFIVCFSLPNEWFTHWQSLCLDIGMKKGLAFSWEYPEQSVHPTFKFDHSHTLCSSHSVLAKVFAWNFVFWSLVIYFLQVPWLWLFWHLKWHLESNQSNERSIIQLKLNGIMLVYCQEGYSFRQNKLSDPTITAHNLGPMCMLTLW